MGKAEPELKIMLSHFQCILKQCQHQSSERSIILRWNRIKQNYICFDMSTKMKSLTLRNNRAAITQPTEDTLVEGHESFVPVHLVVKLKRKSSRLLLVFIYFSVSKVKNIVYVFQTNSDVDFRVEDKIYPVKHKLTDLVM